MTKHNTTQHNTTVYVSYNMSNRRLVHFICFIWFSNSVLYFIGSDQWFFKISVLERTKVFAWTSRYKVLSGVLFTAKSIALMHFAKLLHMTTHAMSMKCTWFKSKKHACITVWSNWGRTPDSGLYSKVVFSVGIGHCTVAIKDTTKVCSSLLMCK